MQVPDVIPVHAGFFFMGSDEGRPDERPVHRVNVGPFRLGRTPITNAEYAPFLATGLVSRPPWWTSPAFSDPLQPIVGVTWFDAMRYTQWLSDGTGRRWRLPREEEWEAAARGGIEGAPTSWGWSVPDGEIPEGSLEGPWPVGRGTANGYGLYDMGTIIHEWCLDSYRSNSYDSVPDDDLPKGGERRASRGGSWRHQVRFSSPSARSSLPPTFRYADYGFRVLEEIGTP
jgi:sulfatase modifying factor 1